MTEEQGTVAMEETQPSLHVEDVEMPSIDDHAPDVDEMAPAAGAVEDPAPTDEPSAASTAEAAEDAIMEDAPASDGTETICNPIPTSGSADRVADVVKSPVSESPGSSVEEKTESAPVKEEQREEANATEKRNEPSIKELVEIGNENGSAKAPAAKRLKVVPKPTDSTTETPALVGAAALPVAIPPVATTAVPAPLMMSRDDMAKMEEDDGLLKFDVITNDGSPEHMIQLTTLKNIFARQLPKMPREYIVRLVFDRNHRSMVILKNGKQVIGGICYRPFEPNHFAEIAFCAINAADQVKGYGTRLMNHLKEFVKASGITHFLTYADNYAIGYFKKQGFAKVVSMPRPNWFGYIKDYDGGTLMECTIHHQINYLRITSMVHAQRKKIQDKIKERSHADIVYPGLTQFAEGRTMDLYMVPGVQEAGWSRAVIRNSRVGTRDPGSLKTQLQQLWKHMSSHRSAWPFHEPVDTSIVVDYLDYIKEPVDLTLIQKRIESGHYLSKAAFKDDLDKMCNNCMLYNTPDTNYYKAAKDLQEFIEKRVQVTK